MKKKLKIFLCLIALFQVHFSFSQIRTKLLQQFTVTSNGVTDTVDLMPIAINSGGDVIVSGNQKMNSTQYDANTVSSGINSWISSFNSGTGKAFITCSATDLTGNTYVAGGIRQSVGGIDFLVVKYNSVGAQQWVYYYNGPNNTTDCASAILVQGSFVYVTGASDGSPTTLIDYATAKINASTGSQVWVSRYNYNNSIDVPTGITFDGATSSIFVTGSSGTTFTNYDFATVKYAISNGAQTGVVRTANTNAGAQDQAYSMATDNAHNIYVVGTTKNGTNYNVQLQKLDTSLNTVYTRTFDAHGYDDAGVSLTLDSHSNVYIAGVAHKSNGTKEFMVLKYDKNGNYKWKFLKQPTSGQDAEALRIKLMSDNEIFVGGNAGSGNNQDVILYCLDSMGVVEGEKRYNGTGNLKDKFMDLAVISDKIYVSARTCTASTSTVDNNITIGYKYKAFSQSVASVGTGAAIQRYVNGEVIISFNKKTVKMSTINNKEILFGQLSDFVQDSTCNKIAAKLDPDHRRGLDAKILPTRKIYFKLTEGDSLSETRNGNYVKVPEFYCVLAVQLESWINTKGSISPLNQIDPDINYAQLNNVYVLAGPPPPPPSTNDTEFSANQGALHPVSSYSLGHINADSAWAVVTGTSSVRLGILDTGIEPHADLPTTIPGYDFVANSSLSNGDLDNHGTGIAGTAGAIRNNNTGIAGVAGGDASTSQAGVTLYDCRVSQSGYVTDAWTANAIQTGVQGANIGGFALHAVNFGFFQAVSAVDTIWGHGVNQLQINQMNFANRNGVAICAPKSNYNFPTYVFPTDWSDEIIMSIGSSGKDGSYCKGGSPNCSNSSTQWGRIDFVAPGTNHLVKTLDAMGGYFIQGGTSYATPHVSGVVSLMMGYRNSPNPSWNNLVHEDCEYILQKTATDCSNTATYNEKVGYDSLTGWGRVNAYNALKAINNNYYRIRHISETVGSTSTSGALFNQVYSGTMYWTNYPSVPSGTYATEIWKRTTIINFTLLASETIIDSWPLNKECYGTKFDNSYVDADRPYYGHIDQISSTSCTMSTYYYKIPSLSVTMPYEMSALKSAFSLYTYDNTGTVGLKNNPDIINYANFKLFPNPHSAEFDVLFNSDFDGQIFYNLTNVLGQIVAKGSYKSNLGKNNIKVSTSNLTNGVYIFSIFNNNKELYKQKVIKE